MLGPSPCSGHFPSRWATMSSADYCVIIIDPYFTAKEPGKGTGMGLAIIHGIISEYGGAVTVESEVGQGTTFHAYFPTVGEGEIERVEGVEEVPTGNGRILFIDDEELLAEMEKICLNSLAMK